MKFIKTVKTDDGDELKLQRETDAAVEQRRLEGRRREADAARASHLQQVTNRPANKEIKHV